MVLYDDERPVHSNYETPVVDQILIGAVVSTFLFVRVGNSRLRLGFEAAIVSIGWCPQVAAK